MFKKKQSINKTISFKIGLNILNEFFNNNKLNGDKFMIDYKKKDNKALKEISNFQFF